MVVALPFCQPDQCNADRNVKFRLDLGIAGALREEKSIPLLPINYEPPNRDTYATFLKPAVFTNDLLAFLEKPYIRTNKPYYYPGEKIWFSATMLYANPEFKDLLSSVLYVELIGPGKKIVQSQIHSIKNQVSWGDFDLPDTLKSGLYHLRALHGMVVQLWREVHIYTTSPHFEFQPEC